MLGLLWSLCGLVAALLGFVLMFYLLDSLLPALDRGVLRAGLRGGISCGAAFLIYQTGRAIATRGRQMRVNGAATVMARDPRPPVLYFRSFADDKFSYFDMGSSFEENLAIVLGGAGPVVAIGRPKEALPPLGAARWYVGDANWQEAVLGLLRRATAVVIRPGLTPGILWEVKASLQNLPIERLLIASPAPQATKKSVEARELTYAGFRQLVQQAFPAPLPESLGAASFIAFDPDGRPRLLAGGTTSKRLYRPRAEIRATLAPFAERLGFGLKPHWFELSPMLIAIALVAAITQVTLHSGPTWTKFAPVAGGFTAELPGPATEATKKVPTAAVTLVMREADAQWEGASYSITHVDYPASLLQGQLASETLDHVRDGMLAGNGGKLLRERPITIGGVPGRDLVIEVKSAGVLVKARFYLIGSRLLEMVAVLPADSEYPLKNSSDVEHFFSSLRLNP